MSRLLTLLPMACDGVGPSFTCTQLLNGMSFHGLTSELFTNRVRQKVPGVNYRRSLLWPFSLLPYNLTGRYASRKSSVGFLSELREGDIAYLWPTVGLSTYEAVHSRGVPIIGEGINTRMRIARDILDQVYAAEGLAPNHGITDARIEEEEAKLALTTAFFAPSRGVELSLLGSALDQDRVMPASYGVSISRSAPERTQRGDSPFTVLFVGSGSLRKGLHQLLRAWSMSRVEGRLVIVGQIYNEISHLCADLLNLPSVEVVGFSRDVDRFYDAADIFVIPSFEEGDPLVTYEAAARGLPVIASLAGGGRMLDEADCIVEIDPKDPETIAAAMRRLFVFSEERHDLGKLCREAASRYTWSAVGRRRVELLCKQLDGYIETVRS